MASAFYGWDLARLEATAALYQNAIDALAVSASYQMSVMGKEGVQSSRSVTRTNLAEIKQTLAEICDEIRRQNGEDAQVSRVAYADFRDFGN